MGKNILIVAGEPSGDIRAGELLKELNKLLPDSNFWGIGGDLMASEGVELTEHIRNLSLVGVWEIVLNLKKIFSQYKQLTKNIIKRKPDMAILVDYPGFNLKIARFLHKQKIPVVYYVIPQVWVWGKNRVKTLKTSVDKSLVLFDFEKTFLEQHGASAEFTGHPLMDKAPETIKEKTSGNYTIALLPGSRKMEINNMLPEMLETTQKLKKDIPNLKVILSESSNIPKSLYEKALSKYPDMSIEHIENNTFETLGKSDFAIVTSGTATLETAITGTPMIVTYKGSALTALIFFTFVRFPHLGLVNIIAGKTIVPELLQWNATSEKMYKTITGIINNPTVLNEMKDNLKKVKNSLGEKGASKKAAQAILRFTEEKNI
jgi:lipid-A-disaccharide synthase